MEFGKVKGGLATVAVDCEAMAWGGGELRVAVLSLVIGDELSGLGPSLGQG